MKALVTGATGFVGGNLVRALVREDVEVRALVRSNGPHLALEGLAVDRVLGDLDDPKSLRAAASGCDVVFHTAALTKLWDRDPKKHFQVNVMGTRNILTAAEAAGVERVVHTSTWIAVGRPSPDAMATEDTPLSPGDLRGRYRSTKWLAKQEVLARHRLAIDCTRAVSELGVPQSSVAEALEKSVRWFRDHGYA